MVIGGIITEYLRPSLIKYYLQAGFDFVFIENEHTWFSPADIVDTVLCARDNGLPVIAKTPQLERAEMECKSLKDQPMADRCAPVDHFRSLRVE